MQKKLCICSGGMDSTTLLYELIKKYKAQNIKAITFLYGSNHMRQEVRAIKTTCSKLKVEHEIIDLRPIFKNFKSALLKNDKEKIPYGHYEDKNMKKTVVPFRNGILLSIAVGIAESNNIKEIYYGAHAGDHAIYPDCRKNFIKAISNASGKGTYNNVKILAPYSNINKVGILKRGIKFGVDYSNTWTCYNPQRENHGKSKACGKCGSCRERLEAFKLNNIKDPLNYINQ